MKSLVVSLTAAMPGFFCSQFPYRSVGRSGLGYNTSAKTQGRLPMEITPLYTKIEKLIELRKGIVVMENPEGFPTGESNIYILGPNGSTLWKAEKPNPGALFTRVRLNEDASLSTFTSDAPSSASWTRKTARSSVVRTFVNSPPRDKLARKINTGQKTTAKFKQQLAFGFVIAFLLFSLLFLSNSYKLWFKTDEYYNDLYKSLTNERIPFPFKGFFLKRLENRQSWLFWPKRHLVCWALRRL